MIGLRTVNFNTKAIILSGVSSTNQFTENLKSNAFNIFLEFL
jgi:hypothetical protein